MENPKRARSGKPRIQPRGSTCVDPSGLQSVLERIRQAAGRDKRLRFTGLWHHVYKVDRLRKAYYGLKRGAAPGIDGKTWRHYGEDLEENLQDLSGRLKRGAYRAKPVRRAYIPKADGRQRPLSVTVLADKVAQRAAAEVMNAIYEEDFLGFSYGFRAERGPHDTLDALYAGIMMKPVGCMLDADIRGYFDSMDHEWLVRFVEHRIADKQLIRHIKKWLNAGVLEDGTRTQSEEGVHQGGSISPLLANIYLHYVFDLRADRWRRKYARGSVVVVRFADDFVVGFQYGEDAERFWRELRERFSKFDLRLQDDKTRLIEFGRFAAENRKRRGDGKPEGLAFLGFLHVCAETRKGKYMVLRQTLREKMQAKLKAIKIELRRRLQNPIQVVGQWLRLVLLGHYQCYGVPSNGRKLAAFQYQIRWLWYPMHSVGGARGDG